MHVKRCNAGDAGSRGQRRMPLFVKSDPPPKRPDVRLVVLSEVAAVWSAVSRWQHWCGERQSGQVQEVAPVGCLAGCCAWQVQGNMANEDALKDSISCMDCVNAFFHCISACSVAALRRGKHALPRQRTPARSQARRTSSASSGARVNSTCARLP